jgi:hypothetical protein
LATPPRRRRNARPSTADSRATEFPRAVVALRMDTGRIEMTGIFLALLLFGAIAAIGGIFLSTDEAVEDFADVPQRLPNPGARDRHSVGYTLGRAPVPTWG